MLWAEIPLCWDIMEGLCPISNNGVLKKTENGADRPVAISQELELELENNLFLQKVH